MNLEELKSKLHSIDSLNFQLPNGTVLPEHFHLTELGLTSKKYIDCGGTIRNEAFINFQLWEQNGDENHRLNPKKLLKIIEKSENVLELPNAEIEVEYQGESILKYNLEFKNGVFHLLATHTDCLAKENCGIPEQKPRKQLNELQSKVEACCSPESSCC